MVWYFKYLWNFRTLLRKISKTTDKRKTSFDLNQIVETIFATKSGFSFLEKLLHEQLL